MDPASETRADAEGTGGANVPGQINDLLRASYARALRGGTWPVDLKQQWPLLYSSLREDCIVFVGINPSEAEDFPLGSADELDDLEVAQRVLEHERRCLGLELGASCYPYYAPFSKLAPHGWSHIDLFPVREKKQEAFKAALRLDERGSWHPLAREWFELSLNLLAALRPRVVVVVNAFASELLHDELPDRWGLEWDPSRGWHHARLSHATVPFFFSGMLTGARALDRYSKQRLRWHIDRAFRETHGAGRIAATSEAEV